MDKMESLKGFGAYLKRNCLVLWDMFLAASFKTKAAIGVVVMIVIMVAAFGAPDKTTVAKALPDYATPADLTLAKASLQRDIDGLTADLHQMRIELNAVEEKLAEPKPAPIETGSIKKTKKRR